jgi:ATP-dependent protease ClpP protease subunit
MIMNRYHPYLRYNKNLKFRNNKKDILGEENNDTNSLDKLSKINSFFDFNNDEDVYLEENHLYFKSDVDSMSVNKLCTLIRKYIKQITDLQYNNKIAKIEPNPLYVHLTTYGGDLHQAFLGYDYIKNCKIPIYTVVEGFNASAGTIMSLGGKKRYITPSSIMLIHQLSTAHEGKFNELEEDYENSKELMERMKILYFRECQGKMTKKQIMEELKHDRWWDSEKCIKKGLCDEIWTNQS